MIYFGSFFTGVINGLFASGAGQILVFVLVFILKEDTYKVRKMSLFVIGLASLLTLARYLKVVNVDIKTMLIVGLMGLALGSIGTKMMKKVNPNFLNLCSGVLITGLSLFKLFGRG